MLLMPEERLIILTKYPEPGRAKTRLIPALGAIGAANLHRALAHHTIATLHAFNPEVRYTGGNVALMRDWLSNLNLGDLNYVEQGNGDLGDRMAQGFVEAFRQGFTRIVMIGTDCPAIDADLIKKAFSELSSFDLVLGPASDGGYYLIGLQVMIPELFKSITWSTDSVLQNTLAIADRLSLTYSLLPTLSDIDRPDDLIEAKRFLIPFTQLD